jgi:hypothetical protein
MDATAPAFDLRIRYQVYRCLADNCRAPTHQELASLLGVPAEEVRQAYYRLHLRHMIFLDPGSDRVRMAHPFSAVPTRFKVKSGGKEWWANCAWDSLGIAAALQADADIAAVYPDSQDTVDLHVRHGAVDGRKHIVYFPLPCRHWYDDLIFT